MSLKLLRQPSQTEPGVDPGQRIKRLTDYGSQVEIDQTLAIKLYLRSGREMLRMANMYCDDGQLESAFILYYKFITLFVEKLPQHTDYKSAPKDQLSDFKRKVSKVFPIAEEIKKKLKTRYAEEEMQILAKQRKHADEEAALAEKKKRGLEEQMKQDEELARKLCETEEVQLKDEQDVKYKMLIEQEGRKIHEDAATKRDLAGLVAIEGLAGPGDVTVKDDSQEPLSSMRSMPTSDLQYLESIDLPPPQVPDRELKKNLVNIDPNDYNVGSTRGTEVPVVDRSKKPRVDHHMSLGEFSGIVSGLRSVVIPSNLMSNFLDVAESNTRKEVETMGILCGRMTHGSFKITHLFVPQQHGGHDSCDMKNEEELIFYQDNFNLITLGWIHTHPTQTAFLSSVDLHSHFPWQRMMPEAIAVVCSPKFSENGIFKLTGHGLEVIGSCKQSGFHPHQKEPPLFETCSHVYLSEADCIQVEDKRR